MTFRKFVLSRAILGVAALAAAGCGSSSPSGPSGTGSVRVEGTVLGGPAGVGVAARSTGTAQSAGAASGPIIVTVTGTSISVTVSGNGTFEIEGLPEGTFTLVFTQGGVILGQVTVTNVAAGADVQVVVQVTGGTVILVQLKIQGQEKPESSTSCLISGGTVGQGIELEGDVATIVNAASFKMDVNGNRSRGLADVSASAASFTCVGKAKSDDCKAQLQVGAKVHVSGTLTTCTPTAATVVATGVKIQK